MYKWGSEQRAAKGREYVMWDLPTMNSEVQNLMKLSRGAEHGTGGIVKITNVVEGSVSPKWMCRYAMIKE